MQEMTPATAEAATGEEPPEPRPPHCSSDRAIPIPA